MKRIKNFSLRVKLTISLLLVAIFPLLLLSKLFFIGSEDALRKITLAQLSMSAEYKVGEIHLFLETLKTNTTDFSSDGFIKNELIKITNKLSSAQHLNDHLRQNKLPTKSNLMFIDVVNTQGLIIASTLASRIGKDLSEKLYYQKGLSQSYVAKFIHYPNLQLLGAVASPIISNDKTQLTLGVLVNHYRMNKIQDLFSGELLHSLGAKSEHRILSAGESIYMLTIEGRGITTSEKSLIDNQHSFNFDTHPIKQARQFNKESQGIWKNHLSKSVLGVSIIAEIDGLKFILLAEQEIEQAFQLINTLKQQFYLLLIFTVMVIIILSSLLSYFIVKPLKKVIDSLDIIASGEFDIDIKQISQHDELENLVNKFNNMAKNLKEMKNVSDHKNKQLLELSIRDHLTGLFNHRHLIEHGDIRVLEANRNGMMLGLLMIDIDHFKRVNDRYGHPCGDYVITEIALLLKGNLRSIDILARYGGEEFAVIMPNTTIVKAKIVADKICKKIQEHKFNYEQEQFEITVSIGIAIQQKSENKIMEIIKRADQALYQSKNNGRNQVSVDLPISRETHLCH
ncbi:MAG: diguanylate cyclase [Colwellia sp.]|nr:diguanylate cyclase [Colwellia sp.]